MTIYNATSSELSDCILEISRARQPYIFASEYVTKTAIVIKYQTSKRRNSTFKRYSLSHSQFNTFVMCCEALQVPVYYVGGTKHG